MIPVCPPQNPRNKIKLKNADTSPVESAYNKKRQCYFIEHSKSPFVFAENSIDAIFRFIQFKSEFNQQCKEQNQHSEENYRTADHSCDFYGFLNFEF